MGEITDCGNTSDVFSLITKRKENQLHNDNYNNSRNNDNNNNNNNNNGKDFDSLTHFSAVGQAATLEECLEAGREELQRLEDDDYMTEKQKKQIKKTKTENDDEVKEKKERRKYVRRSIAQAEGKVKKVNLKRGSNVAPSPEKDNKLVLSEDPMDVEVEVEVDVNISPSPSLSLRLNPSDASDTSDSDSDSDSDLLKYEEERLENDIDNHVDSDIHNNNNNNNNNDNNTNSNNNNNNNNDNSNHDENGDNKDDIFCHKLSLNHRSFDYIDISLPDLPHAILRILQRIMLFDKRSRMF